MTATTIGQVVAACARRPWVVIAVAAALCAGAFTYIAGHFAIDTDSAKLIPEDVRWRKLFEALQRFAGKGRSVLLAVIG